MIPIVKGGLYPRHPATLTYAGQIYETFTGRDKPPPLLFGPSLVSSGGVYPRQFLRWYIFKNRIASRKSDIIFSLSVHQFPHGPPLARDDTSSPDDPASPFRLLRAGREQKTDDRITNDRCPPRAPNTVSYLLNFSPSWSAMRYAPCPLPQALYPKPYTLYLAVSPCAESRTPNAMPVIPQALYPLRHAPCPLRHALCSMP